MKIKNLYTRIPGILLAAMLLSSLMLQFSSCKKDDEDPSFTLTVQNGSGSGTYKVNTVVAISANPPAAGAEFDRWTGNVSRVADVNNPNTTITMPASNTTITATYTDLIFTLTVENGTGDGEYEAGEVVNIVADAPEIGKAFAAWTGDVAGVADVSSASTTFTMPSGDATITATYEDLLFDLMVEGGTGSGEYTYGAEVSIAANAAPSEQYFDKWIGDIDALEDEQDPTTIVTMPAENVTVTATYSDIPAASAIEGTWKIESYFEVIEGGTWQEIETSANNNFRITFSFTDKYVPSTYEMVLGAVLEVPNYKSDKNSGEWWLDDLNEPKEIVFDPNDDNPTAIKISKIPSENSLIIYWTIDYGIEGKPTKTVRMELVPE